MFHSVPTTGTKKRMDMNFNEMFLFCPKCGSRHFGINDGKSRKCGNCGFVYYMNPSSATAAFIKNERGELLINRRSKEPAKGTLDLPGGFVDYNETAEEGIAREVKEETGLEITACRYLFSVPNVYRYCGLDIPTLDMFYECRVAEGSCPAAADDAAECFWLPVPEVRPELFGLRSIRHAVSLYLQRS